MTRTMRWRHIKLALLVAAWVTVLSTPAYAQSAIAGVVTDETRGVLPGVTVEAASPALIEQLRSAVTDGQGRYSIVDLRPGTYTVTFTLSGFATVVREGIVLTAGFTAPVNVQLTVGAIEETLTVSGASPVVDVQSVTRQQVLTREVLDAVPTGRNVWGIGQMVLGVKMTAPDVGGTGGMQQTYMSVHGSPQRNNAVQVDGMSVNGIEGDGAIQNYFNEAMFQEMSYQTSGLTAEVQASGVRVNMIPRDGGNTFSGSVFSSITPGDWQTDNFTPELAATGLRAPNRVDIIHDLNPALGGPIQRDRLWFFSSVRRWGVDQFVTDSFYNLDPTLRRYRPDLSRQTVDDNLIHSYLLRLTTQVAQKHKFAAYLDRIIKFRGHECGALSAEERCGIRSPKRYFTAQAKYTGTLSSRVLVELGWSENDETYSSTEAQPHVKPDGVGRLDRITGEAWSAPTGPYYFREPDRHTIAGSVSYVTGSHMFKSGFQLGKGGNRHYREMHGGIGLYQEYRNGVPASVVVYNTPQLALEEVKHDLGIYVQDSWTIDRLTLNPGIRFELFNTYVPAQASPAGRFVPFRQYEKIENLPDWTDVAPRIGVSYDVFGDAKTALKAHVGKYVEAFSTVGFAAVYNPMVIQSDRRTWTDRNGDDTAQDNEIGPVNSPFNVIGVLTRNPDADIKRPYQWHYTAGVEREVRPGVSVSFSWVRRDYRRMFWTDNLLTTHADYTAVPIQNPIDASETILVYNLDRAKRGLVSDLDSNSENNRRWYNGFDVGFTARVGGGTVFGGVSTGREIRVTCDVNDPNNLRFCDQRELDIPYLTQVKLGGVYTLPYDVQVSGNWQSYPGAPGASADSLNVNYVVDRTVIPALTLSSVTVNLIEPGTKYLKRWNQVDIRFAKKFQIRNVRLQGQFDMFNALNTNTILNVVQTFGSSLDRPTSILQGRLFAVGVQAGF